MMAGTQKGISQQGREMQTGDPGSVLELMGFHEDKVILAQNVWKLEMPQDPVPLEKQFGETVAQHVRVRIQV